MVLVIHHIASDGWSLPIFVKELFTLYQAQTTGGTPPHLGALELQYADYAIWQQRHTIGGRMEEGMAYWTEKLANPTVLNLPTDFVRPAVQSNKGTHLNFVIDSQQHKALQTFANQEGVTLFMVLLTAFKLLLHKYSGQDDIIVGTPIANRTHPGIESLIGFFLNTLALRTSLSGNPTVRELLNQVKETTLESYTYQDIPFEKIVNHVVSERNMSHSPLFQAMLVLQNNDEIPALTMGEVNLELMPFRYEVSKFDLSFNMRETVQGLNVDVEYGTDLFEEATILRLVAHYKRLLDILVAHPTHHLSEVNMLGDNEKQALLTDYSNDKDYDDQQTVLGRFEEHVQRRPDSVALVQGDEMITYRDLNDQAQHLGLPYHGERRSDYRKFSRGRSSAFYRHDDKCFSHYESRRSIPAGRPE